MARKILCLALSASMITGNLAWNVFAADAEDVQDQTSQLQLNCETKALELLDNGRSIAAKVCLTQPDSLIESAVHKRYSYGDQQWYFEMPMTYFVRLSR